MKKTVLLWLRIAVSLMFIFAALPKLAGAPPSVQAFEAIGLGQWFRYATGLLELSGASLLLVPSLAAFGAAVLASVLIGAIATHALVLGGSALPAFALLVATATIGWSRGLKFPWRALGSRAGDRGRASPVQTHG
jgi:uncharacterized membrane protein YphA (DoxX/SURF4 family)